MLTQPNIDRLNKIVKLSNKLCGKNSYKTTKLNSFFS